MGVQQGEGAPGRGTAAEASARRLAKFLGSLKLGVPADALEDIAGLLEGAPGASRTHDAQRAARDLLSSGQLIEALAERGNERLGRSRRAGLFGGGKGNKGHAVALQRIRKSLAVLRDLPKFPPDWLWSDRALLECDLTAWKGLLGHAKGVFRRPK